MSAKNKLHQLRLQEWTSRFSEQKSSGLTVKQWCDQNDISIHAYNYWKHQLKEEVVEQVLPDIVPISLPTTADQPNAIASVGNTIRSNRANCTNRTNPASLIKLSINGISIELDPSVPETFLFALIKAARYA